ncbi:MAG: hypothetical protein Hyperionvirus23_15 [Hyperionvirus sp.]|uniref:Uncharacterized protein n=1 Tax=Hyperionvirus sp. TaxID=2487770 RepID=A0A3G5AAT3_9VIRU|nr:MAG: hypothetical protein Hyperionvirus23_15 [Hyperionvirus sp.]
MATARIPPRWLPRARSAAVFMGAAAVTATTPAASPPKNQLYTDAHLRCTKETSPDLCRTTVDYLHDMKTQLLALQSDGTKIDPLTLSDSIEQHVFSHYTNLLTKCHAKYSPTFTSPEINSICNREIARAFFLGAYALGGITIPNFIGITATIEINDIDKALQDIDNRPITEFPKIVFSE